MRIKTITAKTVLPVKSLSAENLSDVVVLAGPNGVGKTRLIEGLLQFFQNPRPQDNIRLVIEATCQTERTDWGKPFLDTNLADDAQKLRTTLQKNRQRSSLK